MNKPLTLEQAQHICNTYQFLEGTPFDQEFSGTTPIEAVLVVPYSEQDQQEFIDDFDMLGYTNLNPYNDKNGYDVIALSRYRQDQEICVWMDVRSFVKNNIKQVAKYHKAFITSANPGTEVLA